MQVLTFFILLILGIKFKKTKTVFFLQGLWMWLFIGFNTGGVDYEINKSIFQNANLTNFGGDSLAQAISYLFRNNGFSFMFYNAVTVLVAIIIIMYVIYKSTENCALVFSFCLIYPLIDFTIQKRYFLAMSFVVLALYFYLKDSLKNKLIFAALIIVAFGLHSSTIVYLIFLLVDFIPKKYRTVVLLVIAAILLGSLDYLPILLNKFNFLPQAKINLYFYELRKNSSIFKSLFWILWQLLNYMLLLYFNKKISKDGNILDSMENAIELNKHALVILPFYAFDPVFTRLYRPIVLYIYIAISSLFISKKQKNKETYYFFVCELLMTLCSFIIFYVITGLGFYEQVIKLFENNAFFELFNFGV